MAATPAAITAARQAIATVVGAAKAAQDARREVDNRSPGVGGPTEGGGGPAPWADYDPNAAGGGCAGDGSKYARCYDKWATDRDPNGGSPRDPSLGSPRGDVSPGGGDDCFNEDDSGRRTAGGQITRERYGASSPGLAPPTPYRSARRKTSSLRRRKARVQNFRRRSVFWMIGRSSVSSATPESILPESPNAVLGVSDTSYSARKIRSTCSPTAGAWSRHSNSSTSASAGMSQTVPGPTARSEWSTRIRVV